jgi:hypothetical protein
MAEHLREQLWQLPASERAALLVMSIIEHNAANPLTIVTQMARTTKRLAMPLSAAHRVLIAETLRDLSDLLEHGGSDCRSSSNESETRSSGAGLRLHPTTHARRE